MSNSLPAALFITGLKSIALFLPDRTATALSSVFSSISIIYYWTAKSLALHLPHCIITGQSRGYGTGDRIQDTGGGGHTALGLWDRRQNTRHRRRRTYCSGVMGQETEYKTQEAEDILLWGYGTGDRIQDTGGGGHTALGLWDRRQNTRHRRRRTYCSGVMGQETEYKTQEAEDILLWGYGTGDRIQDTGGGGHTALGLWDRRQNTRHRRRRTYCSGVMGQETEYKTQEAEDILLWGYGTGDRIQDTGGGGHTALGLWDRRQNTRHRRRRTYCSGVMGQETEYKTQEAEDILLWGYGTGDRIQDTGGGGHTALGLWDRRQNTRHRRRRTYCSGVMGQETEYKTQEAEDILLWGYGTGDRIQDTGGGGHTALGLWDRRQNTRHRRRRTYCSGVMGQETEYKTQEAEDILLWGYGTGDRIQDTGGGGHTALGLWDRRQNTRHRRRRTYCSGVMGQETEYKTQEAEDILLWGYGTGDRIQDTGGGGHTALGLWDRRQNTRHRRRRTYCSGVMGQETEYKTQEAEDILLWGYGTGDRIQDTGGGGHTALGLWDRRQNTRHRRRRTYCSGVMGQETEYKTQEAEDILLWGYGTGDRIQDTGGGGHTALGLWDRRQNTRHRRRRTYCSGVMGQETEYKTQEAEDILLWGYGTGDRIQDTGGGGHTALGLWDRRQNTRHRRRRTYCSGVMGQETEYKTQEAEDILLWGYGTGDRIQDTGGGGHTALGLWDRRQNTRHRRRRTYCSGVMGQEIEYKTQEAEDILLWGYGTGDRIQDTGDGGHTALGLWDRRQENKTQETEDILLWGYGTGGKRTRHRRRRTYCSGVMGQEAREQDTGDGGHTALGLWDRRQENKTQETEDILLWGYGTGDKRTRHRRRRTQGSGLKGQYKGKGIALWGYGAGVGEEDRRDEGYSTSGL